MDQLIPILISNTLIAAILACLEVVIVKLTKKPELGHVLWLLVFIKLITPPIFNLPLLSPAAPANSAQTLVTPETLYLTPDQLTELKVDLLLSEFETDAALTTSQPLTPDWNVQLILMSIAGAGSLILLILSSRRIYCFHQLINQSQEKADASIQRLCADVAQQFGIRRVPMVYTTRANISPLVWSVFKTKIVLPESLLSQMDHQQLRYIIAHEVAHIARRDHWVRWIEWLALITLWFNPLTWIARKNLRRYEEICCDALVVQTLNPSPKTYASALLNAIEHLACPPVPAPAVASQLNSGKSLQRRLSMIIKSKPGSKRSSTLKLLSLVTAAAVLPLGVAQAHDEHGSHDKAHHNISKDVKIKVIEADGTIADIKLEKPATTIKPTVIIKDAKGNIIKPGVKHEIHAHGDTHTITAHATVHAKHHTEDALNAKIKSLVKKGLLTQKEADVLLARTTRSHTIKMGQPIRLHGGHAKTHGAHLGHKSIQLKLDDKDIIGFIDANKHHLDGELKKIITEFKIDENIKSSKIGELIREIQLGDSLKSTKIKGVKIGEAIDSLPMAITITSANAKEIANALNAEKNAILKQLQSKNLDAKELQKYLKVIESRLGNLKLDGDVDFTVIKEQLNKPIKEHISHAIRVIPSSRGKIEYLVEGKPVVIEGAKKPAIVRGKTVEIKEGTAVAIAPEAQIKKFNVQIPKEIKIGQPIKLKHQKLLTKAWQKLQAQVKLGKITQEQAIQRMQIIKQYTQDD